MQLSTNHNIIMGIQKQKSKKKKTHLKFLVQAKKRQPIKKIWRNTIALLQDAILYLVARILYIYKFLFIYYPTQPTTSLWESKNKKSKKQNSFKFLVQGKKRQLIKKISRRNRESCITARWWFYTWLQEYYTHTSFYLYTTQHNPQHHYGNPKRKEKRTTNLRWKRSTL